MKASELRIGNWVNTIEGHKQIIELRHSENYPKGISHHVTDNVRVSGLFLGPIGGVLPIPLTADWLLKFGFINGEKDNFSFTKNMDLRIIGLENDYNGIWVRKIKHVHQLQNLYFAITGEELELK